LSVLSTEAQLPCLWGALTSTFSSAIYSIVITYIKVSSSLPYHIIQHLLIFFYQPDDFDWRTFLLLSEVKDSSDDETTPNTPIAENKNLDSIVHPYPPQELKRMNRAAVIASIFSAIIGLVTWVVWPLPLYRDWIFTKPVCFSCLIDFV
jgi:hypothetical protein